MSMFRITLRISPYSGVKREPASYQSESEQSLRGVSKPSIVISADGFCDAMKMADAIRLGVQLDERVWRVNVSAIVEIEETARETGLITECAYQ